MATITLEITEERLAQLRERATELGVTPEELANAGISDILSRRDEEFETAVRYLLVKNAELYRRLA